MTTKQFPTKALDECIKRAAVLPVFSDIVTTAIKELAKFQTLEMLAREMLHYVDEDDTTFYGMLGDIRRLLEGETKHDDASE